MGKKGRKKRRHKHQWRKVGALYDSRSGKVISTQKRCIVPGCGATKEV